MDAPFPWFGGKKQTAKIVWKYFGNVPNYVEPFAGSLAILLSRPTPPKTETVNDLDCFIPNFWRAVKNDPQKLIHFADYPISEIDLHSRHDWLKSRKEFVSMMRKDPDYYDAKIAGWWVWGICAWIGDGWCRVDSDKRPVLAGGNGVHSNKIKNNMEKYFKALSNRLRNVRIVCGDWKRVLGPVPTTSWGITGVFLDPPYAVDRRMKYDTSETTDKKFTPRHKFSEDNLSTKVSREVREWCIENGKNKKLRIALCGYEGEHEMPEDWKVVKWKSRGGYGAKGQSQGKENALKERIWFSPYCKMHPKKFIY